jgi:hypothetical protein
MKFKLIRLKTVSCGGIDVFIALKCKFGAAFEITEQLEARMQQKKKQVNFPVPYNPEWGKNSNLITEWAKKCHKKIPLSPLAFFANKGHFFGTSEDFYVVFILAHPIQFVPKNISLTTVTFSIS